MVPRIQTKGTRRMDADGSDKIRFNYSELMQISKKSHFDTIKKADKKQLKQYASNLHIEVDAPRLLAMSRFLNFNRLLGSLY